MKIAESNLLLEYARLMMRISIAQNPNAIHDATEKTVTRTAGYRKLRAFYVSLSRRKRDNFRRQLRAQCDAVASLLKQAAATGEDVTLADVTIEIYDEATREPPPAPPILEDANPPQEQPE